MTPRISRFVGIPALAALLVVSAGCASNKKLEEVRAIAEQAQQSADEAKAMASDAMSRADEANRRSMETDQKVDEMFKKTMQK